MTTVPVTGSGTAPECPDAAAAGASASSGPQVPVAPALRLRLRPGVAVTPLLAGLHLRGRGAAVTLEGSRALPALWQLLEARLVPDAAVRRDSDGDGAGDAQAGSRSQTDAQVQAGAGTQAEAEARAEAAAMAEAEAQTDVRAPATTGPRTNVQAPAETTPQTNVQAVTEAGARGDTRTPADTEEAEAGARGGARASSADRDQAGARLEAALATLTARLREHGLLVEHPEGTELPLWPGSSSAHPAESVEAIRNARPVVAAPDAEGPLSMSLLRALRSAGASPRAVTDARLPAGWAVVTADAPSGALALAVSCDVDGGFVTAPGSPHHIRSDAAAIAARLATGTPPGAVAGPAVGRPGPAARGAPLTAASPRGPAIAPGAAPRTSSGMPTGDGRPSPTAADGSVSPSPAQVSLLAGAAAGRLLAAVAGLPDPTADEETSVAATAGHPAVLVARAAPPEATYRPWAAAPRAARLGPDMPPAPDVAEALRRVTALSDPRLGVLDAPLPGALPQLPASLASCLTPAGLLVAGAVRADLARLEAACRAAELALVDGPSAPVVGASPDHARGRALRRAVLDRIEPAAVSAVAEADPVTPGIGNDDWHRHPQARHWWTVLTRRLGRSAHLAVRQLGAGGAHVAVIRIRPGPTGAGTAPGTVSSAVEATAADAVALAALDAVTRVMAAQHAPDHTRHTALSGAAAPLAAAGAEPAGWADEGWTDTWLAGIATREPALHAALHRLTGLCPTPWRGTGQHPLADALRASGFTVLAGPGGPS
ncbi:hypothetical protein ABZ079_29285 [Streptomyces sp. NPDC006314]|uniref:hypothetical protein n=1 Tax=Streptomyces sp. NPDC006314 TaxID=3154475 RepID=UPI0033A29BA3